MSLNKKTILVFGGSKGASAINQTLLTSLKLIDKALWMQWQVLIVSGKEDYFNLKEEAVHSEYKGQVEVMDYLHQIGDAYDLADLVVCRAGATTVAEITAKGLAAILIPYPYATGNHQLYNARFLEANRAAVVITEEDLTDEKLARELVKLMSDQERLSAMAQNSKKLGKRGAARDIVEGIYDSIQSKTFS